jgi:hypothetical protein
MLAARQIIDRVVDRTPRGALLALAKARRGAAGWWPISPSCRWGGREYYAFWTTARLLATLWANRLRPGAVAVTTRRWLLFAAAVLTLAACGGGSKTTGQAAATTAVASTTLAPTTSATSASSATGASFRFRGMTLTVPDR